MKITGLFGNESALSKVGLDHPVMFTLWGISTYFALAFNIRIGFLKTKYRFYIFLLAISLLGMILTLCCDFDYSVYPQYLAHCIGSLAFSAVTGISVFLLFVLTKNYISAIICGVTLLTDLIMLIIFKETALIEVVPIFVGYSLLLIHNLKGERVKIEA
ncbi:MAG: hypothetical protein ACI4V4_06040 [Eubacterium sp.]